jgi:hypothetical protein
VIASHVASQASFHASRALVEHGACDDACAVRAHALRVRQAASAINQAESALDELDMALFGVERAHSSHVTEANAC